MKTAWNPTKEIIENSHVYAMMQKHQYTNYSDFWKWSVANKTDFWKETVANLSIRFKQPFSSVLDISKGVEQA